MLHYQHLRLKNEKIGIQYKNILTVVLKVILCIFDTISINIRVKSVRSLSLVRHISPKDDHNVS